MLSEGNHVWQEVLDCFKVLSCIFTGRPTESYEKFQYSLSLDVILPDVLDKSDEQTFR